MDGEQVVDGKPTGKTQGQIFVLDQRKQRRD
jgi:hypothetical protein